MVDARLGRYLLIDRINQGGMAEVYLAKSFGYGGTDQVLAIKCIRPAVTKDPSLVSMFVEEAKLSVLLDHPNVAQVFELGRTGEQHYIVMEYISGRDLRAVLDRAHHGGEGIPPELVLHVVGQVLDGLDYAHRKTDPAGSPLHIVHRDVSPHNVIIGYDGLVKLIDFGIAKAQRGQEPTEEVARGKYGYMSPEQARADAVDQRSDIFSVGVLLYEMLSQKRLFEGSSDSSIMERVAHAEILPVSVVMPSVPSDLEAIVLKALARNPDERYPTASDMRDELMEVMLRRFGHPTSRDLSSFMGKLFAEEIGADRKRLEKARSAVAMPEDVVEVALGQGGEEAIVDGTATVPIVERVPMSPSMLDPNQLPEDTTDVIPALAEADEASEPMDLHEQTQPSIAPTRDEITERVMAPDELTDKHRMRKRLTRDIWIMVGALGVAIILVAGTFLLTRPGQPENGTVMIHSSPPKAAVIMNGVEVGLTPYQTLPLSAGKHVIVVTHPGYVDVSKVVEVVPNNVVSLSVDLSPVAH